MPKKVYWSKITQSTNMDAMSARDIEEDGTVWCAEFQTAGRGQRGARWESSTGDNLTFSILLKPSGVSAAGQFIISQVASLGIVNYLHSKGLEAKIKWPNDIYAGDRKICGMLIENIIRGDKLAVSVCGIGLNINQRQFPADLPNPTSLALELEKLRPAIGEDSLVLFDVRKELPEILAHIFELYDRIGDITSGDCLERQYLSHLYRLGELHDFEETEYYTSPDGTGHIRGRIIGIEKETARLLIELENGQLRKYFFKEIRYLL